MTTAMSDPEHNQQVFSSHIVVTSAIIALTMSMTLPTTSERWGEQIAVGNITHPKLSEVSGLAFSKTTPNLLWAHNDSGDTPTVYIIREDGELVAPVKLDGADHVDIEDIATGPCPDTIPAPSCVYVGDFGDNRHKREQVMLYIFQEPGDLNTPPERVDVDATLHLRYPDGAHDVETLVVHPHTGTIYLVQKSRKGSSEVSRVPASAITSTPAAPAVTIPIATLAPTHTSRAGRMFTGGDISPDGRCVALRTYLELHTHCSSDPTNFEAAFDNKPDIVRPPSMLQSEAIAWDPSGGSVLITSERRPAPMVRLFWRKK